MAELNGVPVYRIDRHKAGGHYSIGDFAYDYHGCLCIVAETKMITNAPWIVPVTRVSDGVYEIAGVCVNTPAGVTGQLSFAAVHVPGDALIETPEVCYALTFPDNWIGVFDDDHTR